MRDRRCIRFERLDAVLFFDNLALKVQLVCLLRHIFKVDGDGRAFQVVNALGAYHHEMLSIVSWLCLCWGCTGLSFCLARSPF